MTDHTPSTAQSENDHTSTNDTPETVAQSVLDGFADHTTSLSTTDPTADLDDLAHLGDHFADATVIGLGEATHGTREFFRLKHRLLRYLVTELDVRVFALEANLPEAFALDDYVVHGDGDPREALAGVYFWTWQVESVLAMVEWLREWNADRPLDDRVRFYGFDMQASHGAVAELLEFFETVDPAFVSAIRDDLERVDAEGTPPSEDDDLAARVDAAETVVPQLRDRLADNRARYVESTSERAWELADRCVTILEQSADYRRAAQDHSGDILDQATVTEDLLRVRDRAMADNVDWILDFEDADQVVLWAHDAHLNREHHTVRDSEVVVKSQGRYLADRYGDDYYALGFSFGHGGFQAISEVSPDEVEGEIENPEEPVYVVKEQTLDAPLQGTVDATLAKLHEPLAFLDVRAARTDDRLADWLSTPRDHLSTGASYDPDDPESYLTAYTYADAFDGVCYVDETTRAHPIERA